MSRGSSHSPAHTETSTPAHAFAQLRDAKHLVDLQFAARESTDARRARPEPESTLSRATDAIGSTATAISDTPGLDLLWDGVNSLLESLPGLVKALDAISKLHPYIAGT